MWEEHSIYIYIYIYIYIRRKRRYKTARPRRAGTQKSRCKQCVLFKIFFKTNRFLLHCAQDSAQLQRVSTEK